MSEKTQAIRFHVDDRIQVTIKGAAEETHVTYFSRVDDITSDSYLIEWPTKRGVQAPVKEHDVLLLSMNDRGSAYGMEACVLAKMKKRSPLLKVQPLGPARKIEKRQYLRFPVSMDVELAPRVTGGAAAGGQPESPRVIVTHTVTLSGGGFSINYSSDLPLGVRYNVKLAIPAEPEPIELTAEVVRSETLEVPLRDHTHDIGFAFVDLNEDTHCRIMSFLIRLQQTSLISY
jgi:hypothetical protein